MSSYRELPRNRVAIRVATCFVWEEKVELRVYERDLIRSNHIS